MNPSMAPVLVEYHQKSSNLRAKILRSEEERLALEQKLRSLSNVDSRLKQRQQTDYVQSYFTQLNQESQRAEQRKLHLLNEIDQAEKNLHQLRINAEHLIRSKQEYHQYLESNYTDSQKQTPTANINTYDFNRAATILPHNDEPSTSESFSRSKRTGSLRMELSRPGLYFLLDYIEKELIDSIDKKKFYHHDPPTITLKRTILDIANEQRQSAIKDLEPTTTSMVILDQLPSTIRRTTTHQCLLTEEILSSNVIDLDKDSIAKMLPEPDRSLWMRLIDHFMRLLKHHIMNSDALANKFAPTLLPNHILYLHEKAKSVLKHIVDKPIQQFDSDEDDETTSTATAEKKSTVQTNPVSASSWLNKLSSGHGIDDDDDDSLSSNSASKNLKSPNTNQYDSDFEFFN